jgi:Dual OB-containing domain
MMDKLVILANSVRPGGRCVAGISLKSEKWIRPVSRDIDRAAPNLRSIRQLSLLDIVEIPLATDMPFPPDRYQIENRFVDSWDWKSVGSCSVNDILDYCENTDAILHSHDDFVDPKYFDSLPTDDWKSLQLVKTGVSFARDQWDPSRWRAFFRDGSNRGLYLKVTDPCITLKLRRGDKVARECILTVSIAGPWQPPDGTKPERCYKLVAGVIEI